MPEKTYIISARREDIVEFEIKAESDKEAFTKAWEYLASEDPWDEETTFLELESQDSE